MFVLSFLVACGGDASDKPVDTSASDASDTAASDTGDTAVGPDTAPDTAADTATLEAALDLSGELQRDAAGCEDVSGTAVPGAAATFVGRYLERAGGDMRGWTGTEQWVLFANAAWRGVGGSDCVVTWTVNAVVAEAGACATCDYGMSVEASVDISATTCPAELYAGDETFSTTYGVDTRDDGTASVYYARSGNLLADRGAWNARGLGYRTDRACKWF